MGGCVGGLAKRHSLSEIAASKKIEQLSGNRKRQWSSSPETMEKNISMCHSVETNISSATKTAAEGMKLQEESCNSPFINQGAIAWNMMRTEWVGDQAKRSRRSPKEPIISWSTTYDDLLSTSEPFPQPIPLSEMVDFLVDIWHDEGLYD